MNEDFVLDVDGLEITRMNAKKRIPVTLVLSAPNFDQMLISFGLEKLERWREQELLPGCRVLE